MQGVGPGERGGWRAGPVAGAGEKERRRWLAKTNSLCVRERTGVRLASRALAAQICFRGGRSGRRVEGACLLTASPPPAPTAACTHLSSRGDTRTGDRGWSCWCPIQAVRFCSQAVPTMAHLFGKAERPPVRTRSPRSHCLPTSPSNAFIWMRHGSGPARRSEHVLGLGCKPRWPLCSNGARRGPGRLGGAPGGESICVLGWRTINPGSALESRLKRSVRGAASLQSSGPRLPIPDHEASAAPTPALIAPFAFLFLPVHSIYIPLPDQCRLVSPSPPRPLCAFHILLPCDPVAFMGREVASAYRRRKNTFASLSPSPSRLSSAANSSMESLPPGPKDNLTPARKHHKLLKDGSEVWSKDVEKIFVEGESIHAPCHPTPSR